MVNAQGKVVDQKFWLAREAPWSMEDKAPR